MTNRYLLLFLLFIPFVYSASGQGSGKLTISADLTSIAKLDPEIEVSVINLSNNKEVLRKSVVEDFDYTFPLNGRFMLYFKKEGVAPTRLLLDTRTFLSGYYTLTFDLKVGDSNPDQAGISLPIGTIKFDRKSSSFGYKSANLMANHPLRVATSIRESDVVQF